MTYLNELGNVCYGTPACNDQCDALWVEWYDKYALGGRTITPEGWAARQAHDQKVIALRDADRAAHPEYY